jgi:hypothetical protein
MTVTIEILHKQALELLRVLESLQLIRLSQERETSAGGAAGSVRTFNAVSLDTRGFRFSREEAHECA